MQRPKYKKIINIEQITSITQLLAILEDLTPILDQTDLSNLSSFNDAYIVITQSYIDALKTNWFKDPVTVEKLSIIFARYYLNMLNRYAAGLATPIVWRKAYESSGKPRPKYLSLLIAANAHINHDLPLSLRQAGLGNAARVDFYKSDKLFRQSAKEVILSFSEPNEHLNFLKRRLRPLYSQPFISVVLHYRHSAWRKSLDTNTTQQDLTNKTLKIAKFLR